MIAEFLSNKKVLLLGFGREGKSSYSYIKTHAKNTLIGIADQKPVEGSYDAVFHIGPDYQNAIYDYDIVLKSPGVVLTPLPPKERQKIYSQTELFLQKYRSQVVGITGTKGKSTTASLIYHIAHEHLDNVHFAGNIGIPIFELIDEIKEDSVIIFELSSHQLEYAKVSPRISVILNFFEEHLDHYGTFEKYIDAKKNIFRYQQKGDYFIYNHDNENIDKSEFNIEGRTVYTASFGDPDADIYVDEMSIHFKDNKLVINPLIIPIKGCHNLYNIGVAFGVCSLLGIDKTKFYNSLLTFLPLSHRMECIGCYDEVTYYNDSISTIPEATIMAIKSIPNVSTVIIGGMDRGISYDILIDFLKSCDVFNIILMPDTGKRILPALSGSGKNVIYTESLEKAVAVAKAVTPKNTICLLSPAASSYGFFKNFEERGNKFKELVEKNDKTFGNGS